METKLIKSTLMTEGVVFTILGIIAIVLPVATSYSLTLIVGVLLIVAGLIQLFRVFQNRSNTSFVVALVSAILALLVGVLLLAFPVHGMMVLTLLLLVWFLIHGVIQISTAFMARKHSENWPLLMLSGVISVVLSIIIWSSWPISALWVIGLLLGINLLLAGISTIALAFRVKKVIVT